MKTIIAVIAILLLTYIVMSHFNDFECWREACPECSEEEIIKALNSP